MTKAEALRKHRELWMEISRIISSELIEESLKTELKEDYVKRIALKNIGETEEIKENCYCCEFAEDCIECPIKWKCSTCGDGEYGKWFKTTFLGRDVEASRQMAIIIANLPERDSELFTFYLVDVKSTVIINGKEVAFDYINTHLNVLDAIRQAKEIAKNPDVLAVSVHKWFMFEDGRQEHSEDADCIPYSYVREDY